MSTKVPLNAIVELNVPMRTGTSGYRPVIEDPDDVNVASVLDPLIMGVAIPAVDAAAVPSVWNMAADAGTELSVDALNPPVPESRYDAKSKQG
jgi:hypothetical protein